MSPNFSSMLLRQNLDEVPKPTVLPSGTQYPGVISKYEFRQLQGKNGKPDSNILTYTVKFTGWSPEVQDSEKLDLSGKEIDISSKTSRMDYFIDSETGAYALAKLLLALGLKGSVEEAIPLAVGAPVIAKGEQKLIEKDNSIVFNLRDLSAP